MINSKDKIHNIKHTKKLIDRMKKEINEYYDKKTYLGWSKKKRRFVMKRYKK